MTQEVMTDHDNLKICKNIIKEEEIHEIFKYHLQNQISYDHWDL